MARTIPRTDVRQVRLATVLSGLSRALDAAEGQPEGHAMRTCVIGMRIADVLGLDDESKSHLYYASLLKDLGGPSNASRLSALFGADERKVKRRFKVDDAADGAAAVRLALWCMRGSGRPAARIRRMTEAVFGGGAADVLALRCTRGADLACQLGLPESVGHAIRSLNERWDGRGRPERREGGDIPLLARIVCLAEAVEAYSSRWGSYVARGMARERSGTRFDPELVEAFQRAQAAHDFWSEVTSADVACVLAAKEPSSLIRLANDERLDAIASAFGRVVDDKSPWTAGRSERVRELAVGAAHTCGLEVAATRTLARAAPLRDLGMLTVSNRILDKEGPLSEAERVAVRAHPEQTERALASCAGIADIRSVAGAHHEQPDGRGYHRGTRGAELSDAARLLAVADRFEALTAHRPHRDALEPEAAVACLREEAGTGVCAEALAALERFLESGARSTLSRPAPPDVGPGPFPSHR